MPLHPHPSAYKAGALTTCAMHACYFLRSEGSASFQYVFGPSERKAHSVRTSSKRSGSRSYSSFVSRMFARWRNSLCVIRLSMLSESREPLQGAKYGFLFFDLLMYFTPHSSCLPFSPASSSAQDIFAGSHTSSRSRTPDDSRISRDSRTREKAFERAAFASRVQPVALLGSCF